MDLARKLSYTEKDYYSLPENIRAELIDGQFFYMAAPSRIHQRILSELHLAIGQYIRAKGGDCQVYPAPFAVKLFEEKDTIVEPDISVICDSHKLTDRGCTGAPDWIIEIISPSTASQDYVRKLNLYMDACVGEYWIVDPLTQKIFVYNLDEKAFTFETYSFQDKVPSGIYEDFSIDFAALQL